MERGGGDFVGGGWNVGYGLTGGRGKSWAGTDPSWRALVSMAMASCFSFLYLS